MNAFEHIKLSQIVKEVIKEHKPKDKKTLYQRAINYLTNDAKSLTEQEWFWISNAIHNRTNTMIAAMNLLDTEKRFKSK